MKRNRHGLVGRRPPVLFPHRTNKANTLALKRLDQPLLIAAVADSASGRVELDGYRFQIVKDGDRVRLYSRSGYEWTKRLASLATALTDIRCESAVIDGELVFPNASGNPEFRRLQAVMGSHRQHELAVFAFDLLHHDGTDLRPIPLIKRRRQLTELVVGLRCALPASRSGVRQWRQAPQGGRAAGAGGHRFQASSVGLPLGTIARLGEDEDGSLARGEPGSVDGCFNEANQAGVTSASWSNCFTS